ncbi:WG repeat-containing protein [Sinomicrobium pectinilyticum]|nr:WG repeat-containing protein [Sinomicrobium pectinilyticum]
MMKITKSTFSLISVLLFFVVTRAQIVEVSPEQAEETENGLSRFVNGYARVKQEGRSFYIDTTGRYAFDKMYNAKDFGTIHAEELYRDETKNAPGEIPETVFAVYRGKDDKWGILAPDGTWVLKPEYSYFDAAFRKYGKPVQDWNSAPVPSVSSRLARFEDYYVLDGKHYGIKQDGKWGVYDITVDKMIVPTAYDEFDYCGGCGLKSDYVYARRDGKWGIISFKNEVLVPFRYDHMHWNMRSDDWVLSFTRNSKPVVVYIPTAKEFTDAEWMGGGLLKIKKEGKTGVVDRNGNTILPPVYDDIREPSFYFEEGPELHLLLLKDGLKGLANRKGNIILEPQYEDIRIYGNFFVAKMDGLYGLLNTRGEDVLPPGYDDIYPVDVKHSDDSVTRLFRLEEMESYGFFNPGNGVLVAPAFRKVQNAESGFYGDTDDVPLGLVEVGYDGMVALYDLNGNEIMPMQYEEWDHYDKNYPSVLEVTRKGKKGLFDLNTKREILPSVYGWIKKQDSLKLVAISTESYGGGKQGVFTVEGKQVVPVEYDEVRFLENGLILVRKETNNNGMSIEVSGLFDTKGREVLPVKYETVSPLDENVWLLRKEQRHYLFRPQKRKIIPLDYPAVWETGSPEVLLVSKDSLSGQLYNVPERKAYSEKYGTYYYSDLEDRTNPISLIHRFSGGLARVDKVTGDRYKTGFIDTEGKTIIPFVYDIASDAVKHGMIMLGKGGSVNRVHGKNKKEAPGTGIMEKTEAYSDAVYGYADSTGQIVVPLQYDYYKSINLSYINKDHMVLLKTDRKSMGETLAGLASHNGKVILSPVYSTILPFNNRRGFLLRTGGTRYINDVFYGRDVPPVKFGIADWKGKIIIPAELDDVAFNSVMNHFDTSVDMSFPVLCLKYGQWQYFTRDGKNLSWKAGDIIEFVGN